MGRRGRRKIRKSEDLPEKKFLFLAKGRMHIWDKEGTSWVNFLIGPGFFVSGPRKGGFHAEENDFFCGGFVGDVAGSERSDRRGGGAQGGT
jgi:hypothetical protein